MPCCKCNRTGTCRGCACTKAKRSCINCLPCKLGNCVNPDLTAALSSTQPTQISSIQAQSTAIDLPPSSDSSSSSSSGSNPSSWSGSYSNSQADTTLTQNLNPNANERLSHHHVPLISGYSQDEYRSPLTNQDHAGSFPNTSPSHFHLGFTGCSVTHLCYLTGL